jgi:two-component sensor histidine kinase
MRFSASVQSLVRRVFGVASPVPASVALEVEADDDIALTIERAIPSGLILRELVTNALKHGFPDGRSGRVLVSVRREEPERVVMQVADDGVGLVPGQNGGSLGWQLVQAFARQLGAEILVSHRDGTTVRVTFPLNA